MCGHEYDSRLASVLVDVEFPAMKWQLVMHAEYFGADIKSRRWLAGSRRLGIAPLRHGTRLERMRWPRRCWPSLHAEKAMSPSPRSVIV
jgi:hypothetical protein